MRLSIAFLFFCIGFALGGVLHLSTPEPNCCPVAAGLKLYSSAHTATETTCYYLRPAEKYGRGLYKSTHLSKETTRD